MLMWRAIADVGIVAVIGDADNAYFFVGVFPIAFLKNVVLVVFSLFIRE